MQTNGEQDSSLAVLEPITNSHTAIVTLAQISVPCHEWLPAHDLRAGDVLIGHDGQLAVVEGVRDTKLWEPVYNLRVAEWHTYFVGGDGWSFSAWAHNLYKTPKAFDESGIDNHSYLKHGSHVTPEQHQLRLQTGELADGSIGAIPSKSSSFKSDSIHLEAGKIAYKLLDLAARGITSPIEIKNNKASGTFTMRNAGKSYYLDSNGQMQSVSTDKVYVKFVKTVQGIGDNSKIIWTIRTMFPR